jgi:hypothetical protein
VFDEDVVWVLSGNEFATPTGARNTRACPNGGKRRAMHADVKAKFLQLAIIKIMDTYLHFLPWGCRRAVCTVHNYGFRCAAHAAVLCGCVVVGAAALRTPPCCAGA